jgi:hypothetical protein
VQDRTKNVEAQLGKTVEGQTVILANFAGKPVADLKMMRSSWDENTPGEKILVLWSTSSDESGPFDQLVCVYPQRKKPPQ